ncbi:MAG: ferrous iron transport protein A [Bacteriovoracaceae bacterium]|nr:ferrous iron transport protein A [Bacteriovoracaceae bacterium]
MVETLAQLKTGDQAKLLDFTKNPSLHFKLLSLGVLPGDLIKVLSCAPFGGPIVVKHGERTTFAIRKAEAKDVSIELQTPEAR